MQGIQKAHQKAAELFPRSFRRMRLADEPDSPPPELSASTSALLQEFLQNKAETSDDPFAEDWNLSQARDYQRPPAPPLHAHAALTDD